jgi:hypothetical protein
MVPTNGNVYSVDEYRREKEAAMRRHPCNAHRKQPPLRLTQRGKNLIACTLILLFVSAMGYAGYVEGL